MNSDAVCAKDTSSFLSHFKYCSGVVIILFIDVMATCLLVCL